MRSRPDSQPTRIARCFGSLRGFPRLRGFGYLRGLRALRGRRELKGLRALGDLRALRGLGDLRALRGLGDLRGLRDLRGLPGLRGIRDLRDSGCPRCLPPIRSVILVILILLLAAPRCRAASDPLLVVTKDTLLGAVTGLVLGGTLTLVIDDDSKRAETVRWGVVIGTFAGFGFGIYHASRGEADLFATAHPDQWTVSEKAQLFQYRPRPDDQHLRSRAADRFAAEKLRDSAVPAIGAVPGWSFRMPLLQVNW